MTDRERFEAWCSDTGNEHFIARPAFFNVWQAATRETAQRCADMLMPKNERGDWTQHAHDMAEQAARIRREFGLTEGDA